MRLLRLTLALAVVAPLMGAGRFAEPSGPAKGASPMLTVKAFNHDGDAYCVTCDTGQAPGVVAFVTRNDEATRKLLGRLNEQAKANEEKGLHANVVILGRGRDADGLSAYVREQKLAVRAATVAADTEGLKDWKISSKVSNTVVFQLHHKVDHSVADLSADKLPEHIRGLVGDESGDDGGDHHHGAKPGGGSCCG